MNGLMAENTMESGKIIKWKAMVFLPGLMGEDMKDNISMIKKKAKVFFTGENFLKN